MMTLSRNAAGVHVLRDFSGYNPTQNGESYVEGDIILIHRLNVLVATVVHCSVVMGKCGRHHQKNYSNTYGKRVETATKTLARIVR